MQPGPHGLPTSPTLPNVPRVYRTGASPTMATFAPPRAELVQPPSDREPPHAAAMRRMNLSPEPRSRPGAFSDAGSMSDQRSIAASQGVWREAQRAFMSPEPSLAASTTAMSPSTRAAMKKAPLGASTNQYLDINSATAGRDSPSLVSNEGESPAVGNTPPASSMGMGTMRTTTQRVTPDMLRERATMITVNVTGRGSSGASAAQPTSGSLARRSSIISDRRRANGPSPTASKKGIVLASNIPPPTKVSSTSLIVQVIAVAIDGVDRAMVEERLQSESTSPFVPGRSFCGRVVECGLDVKKLRPNDMVFGLQDFRKCGALAEFVVADQQYVSPAPEGRLSAEQIAALPGTGVMVHQIVQNHCITLPKGSRVLILQAHDHIGLLTMQEVSRLGLVIVAQVPSEAADGVSICRANGAAEVITGDPLWTINMLHESSFALVVDTIGGRDVYDACRRILASHGQFVTCFGDSHTLPNPTNRSHLRSLRRSFFRKDRKAIGYEWIGLDASTDVRSALDSIKVAAQRGAISPRIQSVLPLEDAPRAFVDEDDSVVVVRVS